MKTILYYGNVLYPDLDAASHRTIGNAKSLSVNKTTVALKVGKKFTIKAKEVKKDKTIHICASIRNILGVLCKKLAVNDIFFRLYMSKE